MEEEHRTRLQFHREAIVKDLEVTDISDYLISKAVITDDDSERISAETTRRDRVHEFLRLLVRRGNKAFSHFLESLRKEYEHLWRLLSRPLDDEQTDEEDVRESRGQSNIRVQCTRWLYLTSERRVNRPFVANTYIDTFHRSMIMVW
jgi:hypothetical protein